MKCPHCTIEIHEEFNSIDIDKDKNGHWRILKQHCSEYKKLIIILQLGNYNSGPTGAVYFSPQKTFFVNPKSSSRTPCPVEVPEKFSEDYKEACLVLSDSPKASAALSRRCLQNILREVAKVTPGDLFDEIQEVINTGHLPTNISEALDTVRTIGNFAAHPIKSKITGEIIDVEPGEAEWELDVLESLFDFYFVQPTIMRKKRAALDEKLKEAGKKPMK